MSTATIAPGVYHSVPFADYCAWPELNASTLVWGATSMEHLRAALDGKLELQETTDQRKGRAIHCRLLEPERYKTDFMIASPCCAILSSGSRKGQPCGKTASSYSVVSDSWFCGTHALVDSEQPADYISTDEAANIEAIAAKVQAHDVIRLLRQQDGFEASIVAELESVPVKARMDKLIVGKRCPDAILDVKKVQVGRGGPNEFQRAIISYHYHLRAAWYVDIARQACQCDPMFIWISIEDSYPFSIGVYQATPALLESGRGEYRDLLAKYKACMESGMWPGYSSDVQLIDLPGWYRT